MSIKPKADTTKKSNAGRISSWEKLDMSNRFDEIEKLAASGYTDKMIYQYLGVSHETFYRWLNENSELVESLKRGKTVIDLQVENQLLKRALGYEYEEVTKEIRDGKVVATKVVKKEVVPDTTAQIFWLKNRRPKDWRDKQEVEHSGGLNIKVEWD